MSEKPTTSKNVSLFRYFSNSFSFQEQIGRRKVKLELNDNLMTFSHEPNFLKNMIIMIIYIFFLQSFSIHQMHDFLQFHKSFFFCNFCMFVLITEWAPRAIHLFNYFVSRKCGRFSWFRFCVLLFNCSPLFHFSQIYFQGINI